MSVNVVPMNLLTVNGAPLLTEAPAIQLFLPGTYEVFEPYSLIDLTIGEDDVSGTLLGSFVMASENGGVQLPYISVLIDAAPSFFSLEDVSSITVQV